MRLRRSFFPLFVNLNQFPFPLKNFSKTLLTGVFLLLTLDGSGQAWEPARHGILDLREYEFGEHAYVRLIGEWEFYWEKFIQPWEFNSADPPEPTLYVKVPGYWKDYHKEGMDFPSTGFASYRLRVLLPGRIPEGIGFDMPVFDDSYRLYLDGSEIASNGKPGRSRGSSEPGYKPSTLIYTPVSDTLEILLHVSNFHHRRGAFWKSIQIGNPFMIIKTKQKYRLVVFLSLGVLMAFSLFFIFFYLFQRKDMIILSFSIVLAGVFIRMMSTDLYPITYLTNISWDWIIRMEYLGTYMAFAAGLWYFYRLFPARYMYWFTLVNTGLVILAGLLVFFFRVRIFAYTMLYLQPVVLLMLFYYTLACAWSVTRGKKENLILLAVLVLFTAALVNDIMLENSKAAVSNSYTVQFALQVFVYAQAILIIRRWIRASAEREKLMEEVAYVNKNLEALVEERTKQVKKRNQEIQKKNEDIEASNRELKDALDFKNKVFSIIAHDLKSPVASLVQNSALLDFNLSGSEGKKLIDSFRELSNSALNLIDNLLYWGRSQGSQLKYKPGLLDIGEIIGDLLTLFREMARQKSIALTWEPEGSTKVFADRELVEIICRNLLSNALKFTPKGGEVRIRSSYREGEDTLLLSFRDNGIGIPADRLENIFGIEDMFSTAGTDKERGTGLGLKLCYELVRVNRGDLQLESREGIGTEVRVYLPVSGTGE